MTLFYPPIPRSEATAYAPARERKCHKKTPGQHAGLVRGEITTGDKGYKKQNDAVHDVQEPQDPGNRRQRGHSHGHPKRSA